MKLKKYALKDIGKYKKEEIKILIPENLRGEISDRTSTEFIEDVS